jgi:hypothetical protein
MMATLIYVMCALTSLLCALLLLRGFRSSRARLLFWAALCFAGLAINNLLVFVDERIVPTTDLSVWRSLPALLGVAVLIYGLVWEVQ